MANPSNLSENSKGYTMKKIALAFMCIFATQSTMPLSFQSMAKITGIVTATGLLTATNVEHPILKTLLLPITFKMRAENKETERIVDVSMKFNLIPLIVGYWALKKF